MHKEYKCSIIGCITTDKDVRVFRKVHGWLLCPDCFNELVAQKEV